MEKRVFEGKDTDDVMLSSVVMKRSLCMEFSSQLKENSFGNSLGIKKENGFGFNVSFYHFLY